MSLKETHPEVLDQLEKFKEAGFIDLYNKFKEIYDEYDALTELALQPEKPEDLDSRMDALFDKIRIGYIEMLTDMKPQKWKL